MSHGRPKTAQKLKLGANNEFTKEIQFLQQQKMIASGGDMGNLAAIFSKNPAFLVLETEMQAEIFNARCHDTGETVTIERAKVFKEEWNKMNSKKQPLILNLYSMRLGVNTIISLAAQLQIHNFYSVNLADNAISDYAMHAIKQVISNQKIKSINLASNMISDSGLEMVLEDLAKSPGLKILDLGVLEGSIRKNSFGVDGAKCIATIILQNKVLECIKLQDNDIGQIGGEIIGTAMKSNKNLKHLKISENDLRTQGAEYILKSATLLESLDISKNFIKSSIGPVIRDYLEQNTSLKRLNLEFNELGVQGVEFVAAGLCLSNQLLYLNLRGNGIRDEGLQLLSQAIVQNDTLEELDVSLNDITPVGICYLAEVLPSSSIRILNLARNLLGDESLIMIANRIALFKDSARLEKIDVSSSRLADKGILHFLESIEDYSNMVSLKASDNYISEKIEKILLEVLEKNKSLNEFNVWGNRLSLCCLNRIAKITSRNQKSLEEKEPNKIRTEIYRLKYEQKKIMMAREKLQQQEKEILSIEEQKNRLVSDLEKIRLQEQHKRQGFQERIDEHKILIEKKKNAIQEKVADFERTKLTKIMEIDQLKSEYDKAFKRRSDLEIEYRKMQEQLDSMEYSYKNQIVTLEDSISTMKSKTEEIEERTASLTEEYRLLMKKENELKELELERERERERDRTVEKEKQAAAKALKDKKLI